MASTRYRPTSNMRYGLYDARGYDLPVVTLRQALDRYVAPPTPLLPLDTPAVPRSRSPAPPRRCGSCRSWASPTSWQDPEGPPSLPGLRLAYDGPDATIYTNTQSSAPDLAGHQPTGRTRRRRAHRPRRPRLRPPPGRCSPSPATGTVHTPRAGAGRAPGTARITHYGAQQVTIDAQATKASELVLSDTYYPGWKVTVNGRPARISPVDYMFRGVPVPAGTDRIVFTYDPASFRIGWMISLVAVVVPRLVVVLPSGADGVRPGRHVTAGRTRPDAASGRRLSHHTPSSGLTQEVSAGRRPPGRSRGRPGAHGPGSSWRRRAKKRGDGQEAAAGSAHAVHTQASCRSWGAAQGQGEEPSADAVLLAGRSAAPTGRGRDHQHGHPPPDRARRTASTLAAVAGAGGEKSSETLGDDVSPARSRAGTAGMPRSGPGGHGEVQRVDRLPGHGRSARDRRRVGQHHLAGREVTGPRR